MASAKSQSDRHLAGEDAISIRPPRALRVRFLAYVARTGLSRNAVISAALTDYLDKHDPDASKPDHG
jgi:hypothetical protein